MSNLEHFNINTPIVNNTNLHKDEIKLLRIDGHFGKNLKYQTQQMETYFKSETLLELIKSHHQNNFWFHLTKNPTLAG